MIIGGGAIFRGVYLQGDINNCTIHDNGKCSVKKNNTYGGFKLFEHSIFKNLFLIRQIPYLCKNKILWILPLIFIWIKVSLTSLSFTIPNITILIIFLFLIVFFFKKGSIRNWHGAEHKVVNCFEHSKKLTLANVREESRFNTRCGSTFAIIILVLFIISTLLPYSTLFMFLSIFVALEIFNTQNKYLIFKPLFWISTMFQKYIITSEPSDKELKLTIKCIKILLHNTKENK